MFLDKNSDYFYRGWQAKSDLLRKEKIININIIIIAQLKIIYNILSLY